jgi:all-trans-retinol 13,14-reductase
MANILPYTPIRGLFLTGQDVVTCGVAGAMFGGVLTASAILRRNVMKDAFRMN